MPKALLIYHKRDKKKAAKGYLFNHWVTQRLPTKCHKDFYNWHIRERILIKEIGWYYFLSFPLILIITNLFKVFRKHNPIKKEAFNTSVYFVKFLEGLCGFKIKQPLAGLFFCGEIKSFYCFFMSIKLLLLNSCHGFKTFL